jgi:Raf kinase inhibitor-like YbhB/YbcL family protein
MKEVRGKLTVSCPAFKNNSKIPPKYTCHGEDVNPQLDIQNLPEETKSLVIIVNDPDCPIGDWVHWIVWNIQPTNSIKENSVPGVEGINDFNKHSYGGPCPPSGTHRYFFNLYALDTELSLPASTRKRELQKVMTGHILAKGDIVGLFK